MPSREWSEGVKHSAMIAKCEWAKQAFLLQKKTVNEEEISERLARERRKVKGSH